MNSLLDDCYAGYVNLDSRPDRRAHMEAELARVGIAAARHRGRLPDEWTGAESDVARMRARTPGAIGCWMGQVDVMRSAAAAGNHALVLEDDLIFCSDLRDRLTIFENNFWGQWHVLWLGGTYHADKAVWHPERPADWAPTRHPRVVQTFGAFSTHAYVVHRGAIDLILKRLAKVMAGADGIDHAFIQLQPHLFTYAFVPGCVKQRDDRSNIGNGMTIFSGFAKLGGHWWQDRADDFDPALLGTDAHA